jgi:predicted GNAT family N-acyltransferase
MAPAYRIRPITPPYDRKQYRSGDPVLDECLHRHAATEARRKVAAPFVLLDGDDTILGYYTLAAHKMQLAVGPDGEGESSLVSATLLGRLTVHYAWRGLKLGRFMLMDALHRSWRSAGEISTAGVIAVAAGDALRDFYLHHEFTPLLDHPDRLFLSMGTVERAFKPPGS